MPRMTVEEEFGDRFLDDIIEWISNNFQPDDVFDEEDLHEWAKEYYGGLSPKD